MNAEAPALLVANVGHTFGARAALSDVSMSVGRGTFTALLGPNGAGKTTLFSVITRLYNNQSGRVAIFGHGLDREPSRALARLGVVFQARTLDTDLTVEQNLLYHASLHGIARKAAKARIAELLDRVGLADRRGDKIRTLSGGQSRRIEIARSLVHRPDLLLLDEPTVGLDLESRAGIVAIVRALVREEGCRSSGRRTSSRRSARRMTWSCSMSAGSSPAAPPAALRRARGPGRRLPPARRRAGRAAA